MYSENKLQMVIFDLDGTILEDNKIYHDAFAKVLKTLGYNKDFELIGSAGLNHNWSHLIIELGLKTDKTPDELTQLTQNEFLKRINEITVRDGFFDFVEDLKNNQIIVALATSNNFSVVDTVLQKFGMEEIFDIVTTVEEARFPKPDPDLFLLTARKLDIDPQNCIVIEDASAGVTAAHAANMKVICFNHVDDADLSVSSYNELSFNKVNRLHEETSNIN